jgi:hypothetical protein
MKSKLTEQLKETLEITNPDQNPTEPVSIRIPVVELFFELLDSFEWHGDKYSLLTPLCEGQEELGPRDEPDDVFIMKELESDDGTPLLETVKDENTLESVYVLFKEKHADEFNFIKR